jgi:hypothetical protein
MKLTDTNFAHGVEVYISYMELIDEYPDLLI